MIRNYNVLGGRRDTILKNRSVKELDISPTSFSSKKEKPSMYLGWLVAFLLMFGLGANAQVSGYVFSESAGTYAPITGGTVVATATTASGAGSLDDTIFNLPSGTIPFPFTYDGVPYTGLNISTNGFVAFGATPPAAAGTGTGYNPISGTTAYAGAISVFGGDNNSLFNILGNTGQIRYQTVGVSPNQEFVIQWSNFRPFSTSTSTTLFWRWNYQIRLHENGTINMDYDANFTGAAANLTRQVGLRGPNNTFATNVKNRLITTGTHTWNTSANGTANTSTCAATVANIPVSGKRFTFTPPPPPACTLPNTIVVTQLTPTTASVSWAGAATAVVEWGATGCVAGTGNAAGACGNVLATVSSPQTITGLVPGTVYSVHIRQDCTGSANGFSLNNTVSYTAPLPGESCVFADFIPVAIDLASSVNTLLTSGTTSDGPNGTCSDGTGNPSKKDRWVKFVAPLSGNEITITTSAGTLTDMVMQVWSSCPASGTAIGCSDDQVGLMPELSFCQNQYVAGQTYYIQIWPYSTTATGNYNIKIYEEPAGCPIPPSNDECAGVITIPVGIAGSCPAGAVTGTTVNATATAGVEKTTCDAFGTYLDVFYKFNSGTTTDIQFDFTNITGTNEYGLYTACGTGVTTICGSASENFTLFGLTPNTDYFLVVWANNALAQGTFSFCLNANPVPACVAAPTAPTNGSTTVDSCSNVILSWTSVPFAISYDVYLDAGAGPATTLVSLANATTTFDAGLLLPGTAYSWRIEPKNGSGTAVGCSDFTFTTTAVVAPACVASPIAPVNGSTTVNSCVAVTLSWAAVASATSYDVYFDLGAGPATTLVSAAQTGITFNAGLLLATTAYSWRVVPKNCVGDAVGCSDFTFTTGTVAPACVLAPLTPVEASTVCTSSVNFTWAAVANATSYDVYVDGLLVSPGQAGTSYTQVVALGAHTWQVIPINCVGLATGCATFNFTYVNTIPVGDTFASPIDLGAITASTTVNGDNLSVNCWHDDFTDLSTPGDIDATTGNDVFYKFEITCPGTVVLGTCTSSFDTFLHLLDSTGTSITNDDDSCVTPNGLGSQLTSVLPVGIYYAVVEGFGTGSGTFTLDLNYTQTAPCSSVVNLTMFIEGYYTGAGSMASVKLNQWDGVTPPVAPAADEVEDITVELHDATSPHALITSTTATLKTDGTAVCTFTTAPSGSFYIAVKSSNAIQTWSDAPQTVGASPLSYNFTTAATQAYASNMIETIDTGVWALYSGDLNQDEVIDGTDAPQLTNDVENSAFGVQVTDINGDGAVDGSDVPFFDNNSANSIFANYPF